jgi:hypothetical protein
MIRTHDKDLGFTTENTEIHGAGETKIRRFRRFREGLSLAPGIRSPLSKQKSHPFGTPKLICEIF